MARPTRPTAVPEWARTGTRSEPTEGKKDTGWVTEKPPSEQMNWLQGFAGDWIAWLNDTITQDAGTFAIFNAGLELIGTNLIAVHGIAKGNAPGIRGDSPTDAVYGLGAGGSGSSGVHGDGGNNAYGVIAEGSGTAAGTHAALRIVPIAGDPGDPQDGDVWYNSSTGKLRVRAAGVSVDLH